MTTKPDAAQPAPAPDTVTGASPKPSGRRHRGWLFWIVVGIFAVLYAQDLFQAVTDAFGVPADIAALNALRAEADLPALAVPWLPIIVNLALPPIVFAGALGVSWRRSVLVAALVLATGLALVAVLTLDMYLLAGLLVS
ncbi:MAG TPA: hypothetical protein PK781_06590 [Terrimesophilobacter sp.]|nr:hypothetical protein [Terrimesophilobacter sp.]